MTHKVLANLPDGTSAENLHPGGQLTAAKNLLWVLKENGVDVKNIDIYESNYPPVTVSRKILHSFRRVFRNLYFITFHDYTHFMCFSGFNLSFYERIFSIIFAKIFRMETHIFFRNSSIMQKKMCRLQKLFYRLFLKIPDNIVVQSVALKEFLLNEYDCHSRIITPWVSVDIECKELPGSILHNNDGLLNLIYIGWLERRKGIMELLEVAKICNCLNIPIKFHIIGDGSLRAEVDRSAEKYNNLESYGWQSAQQVNRCYSDADFFILLSHNEGFPNSLMECMVEGVIPICTNVGGIPDTVVDGKNGFLFEVGQVDEVVQTLEKLAFDAPKRKQLSANAEITALKRHVLQNRQLEILSALNLVKNGTFK